MLMGAPSSQAILCINKSCSTGPSEVRRRKQRQIRSSRRNRRILMTRRACLEGSRRPNYVVQKRVRTLKKLVPNGEMSVGLDGLFREAADYIVSLQTRVRAMQVMVNLLSAGSDEE